MKSMDHGGRFWLSCAPRQPKWGNWADLAKVQIGGLPIAVGVWDSGRWKKKVEVIHGKGYR